MARGCVSRSSRRIGLNLNFPELPAQQLRHGLGLQWIVLNGDRTTGPEKPSATPHHVPDHVQTVVACEHRMPRVMPRPLGQQGCLLRDVRRIGQHEVDRSVRTRQQPGV